MLTVVKRTQIYLEERQSRELERRARARRTSKSDLIREAIDAYLGIGDDEAARLEAFRSAVRAVAGIAPYLPDGATYVHELREAGARKLDALDERWRS